MDMAYLVIAFHCHLALAVMVVVAQWAVVRSYLLYHCQCCMRCQ